MLCVTREEINDLLSVVDNEDETVDLSLKSKPEKFSFIFKETLSDTIIDLVGIIFDFEEGNVTSQNDDVLFKTSFGYISFNKDFVFIIKDLLLGNDEVTYKEKIDEDDLDVFGEILKYFSEICNRNLKEYELPLETEFTFEKMVEDLDIGAYYISSFRTPFEGGKELRATYYIKSELLKEDKRDTLIKEVKEIITETPYKVSGDINEVNVLMPYNKFKTLKEISEKL